MTRAFNKQGMKDRRRKLRNKATPEERALWKILRKEFKEYHFKRQFSVGYYILDFFSPRYLLAIELDGLHHANQKEYDIERTCLLEDHGITVIRFWNNEIRENILQIVDKIRTILSARTSKYELWQ